MPHGSHIYAKASDMENATMYTYTQSVTNFHVSIFLTKKQIIIIQKQHPQLGFTFITSLGVVLLMESFQLQMGFSFPFLRANDLRSS